MKKRTFILVLIVGCVFSGKAQQIGSGYAVTADNFNTYLYSGAYQTGLSQTGFPGNISNTWNHLFVIRHGNSTNNHQLQMASSYAENDRLFFRKIASTTLTDKNTTWHELATRGANTFNGSQNINGNIISSGYIQVGNEPSGLLSPMGLGKMLLFGDYGNNNDNIYIARYNVNPDQSELRVNVGDDYNDKFVVGRNPWDNSGFEYMFTVVTNGNVGIGVSYPGVKLDVDGVIRAHEVKLCLNQGCDFVFADDYKLMNLTDLSDFIKTNKHLPDVAPASEMEAEGINLSEMNAKLLQKVEELTLYVIELKREIDELKK